MNYYKLKLIKVPNDLDHKQIDIKKGILKMRKVTRSYKDCEISNMLWSKVFLNYIMIVIALFSPNIPTWYLVLTDFYREVINSQLSISSKEKCCL